MYKVLHAVFQGVHAAAPDGHLHTLPPGTGKQSSGHPPLFVVHAFSPGNIFVQNIWFIAISAGRLVFCEQAWKITTHKIC